MRRLPESREHQVTAPLLRHTACSALALVAVTTWPSMSDGRQTSSPPKKATASPPAPRIPADVVAHLLTLGREFGALGFVGIHKVEGDTRLLSINSNRQSIALSAASAAQKGGTYTPPANARADIVIVSCGDEDLGSRWDCARVSVVNFAGGRVAPLSYSAGPKSYRNALGATWTAALATATYRLSDLAKGFEVRYAGTDGTSFTEVVTHLDVARKLFTELPPTKAMREAAAAAAKASIDAEPDPPDLFVGTLTPSGGGQWTVTSLNQGYTWQTCTMDIGRNSVPLGAALLPGKSVTIAGPAEATAANRPSVYCTAKGRRFEGPVPVEFSVAIERVGVAQWMVRNLTDWGWSYCEASFGSAKATLVFLYRGASATFKGADFTPVVDDTESIEALGFSCITSGKRVTAVRRSP